MNVIPLFPLNIVLFPGGPLPLRIFETRYLDMVRNCMRHSTGFGVVLIRSGAEVGFAETYDVGTTAKIVDFHQLQGGLLGLSCVGEQRFRIQSHRRQSDGLAIGEVEPLAAEEPTRSRSGMRRSPRCSNRCCRSWARATPEWKCTWTMRYGSGTAWRKYCRWRRPTSSAAWSLPTRCCVSMCWRRWCGRPVKPTERMPR